MRLGRGRLDFGRPLQIARNPLQGPKLPGCDFLRETRTVRVCPVSQDTQPLGQSSCPVPSICFGTSHAYALLNNLPHAQLAAGERHTLVFAPDYGHVKKFVWLKTLRSIKCHPRHQRGEGVMRQATRPSRAPTDGATKRFKARCRSLPAGQTCWTGSREFPWLLECQITYRPRQTLWI